MSGADPRHATRSAAHRMVSTRLSSWSDHRLGGAVASAGAEGSGIGGRSAEMDVGGTQVFVKRIPVTDTELRSGNVGSTANLFDLPMFYQYGVGSAGFGAWRELAAHVMSTNWVLGNEYAGFPLMHHWRVLPDSPPQGFADEFGGIDGAVAHWENSTAVRRRLEAIGRSTSILMIFLEHVPRTLGHWLSERREDGSGAPHEWVAEALADATEFMRSRGLVHFDAHFSNVLTDGRQVYFADFGLALSSGFALTAAEAEFHSDHLGYDSCCTASHLLRHLVTEGVRGDAGHEAFLRGWTAGRRPNGVPAEIAALLDRHARSAVVLGDFHRRLLEESKRTPFPTAELARTVDTTGRR